MLDGGGWMRKGWMVGDVMQGVQEDASGIPALSINSRARSERGTQIESP